MSLTSTTKAAEPKQIYSSRLEISEVEDASPASQGGCAKPKATAHTGCGIPVIYSTDLFQPPQDPDDHYDLAVLFGLKELEIRALIFDVATSTRKPEEFGIAALNQMAHITGQSPPPWKIGLRNPLRAPDDKALDQPEEFQGGVALILSTLERSEEQVVMFLAGSCRDFAVAFNRNPDLLRKKVKAVYVNAGNGLAGKQTEWNVALDPNAYVGLMSSGLPIYWCPCFTGVYQLSSPGDVTSGKAYCTYYVVPNQAELLAASRNMVKNYFAYALNQLQEPPLEFLQKEPPALPETPRNMWCTAPFLHAAGRKIYQTEDRRWIACSPENAKELEGRAIEVFRFEPVRVKSVFINENGKLIPEFHQDTDEKTAPIQVFRYVHPDFNEIMPSVLKYLIESL
ncbi:MAG: hypothetical protein FWC50_11575 [Planctomycetaceae bacterium]|nr:hypothetical protein [Planctomycetaceae bacterium]